MNRRHTHKAALMLPDPVEIASASVIALAVVVTIYLIFDRRIDRTNRVDAKTTPKARSAVYLFEGKDLLDATEVANRLIQERFDTISEWDALMIVLCDDFPGLEDLLADLEPEKELSLASCYDHEFQLSASKENGKLKLELHGLQPERTPEFLDKFEQRRLKKELQTLRTVTKTSSQLIWQVDDKNSVTWCNQAYLQFADKLAGQDAQDTPIWHAKPLFENLVPPKRDATLAAKSRHSLKLDGEEAEHWFNISSFPNFEGTLHFASDANEEVRSERAQKAFIQTFAKTFAELSVGLAIFDRSNQLSMFNPALLEITGLPTSLLSSRPPIETFLDKMRAAGNLPEPKDYAAWRDQFSAVLKGGRKESFQETWALPEGQTYRVTGRPHPDGAFAFLFEDISAEISLTRRFRSEIETSQAVLDTLPQAIAVFSPSQTLVMANRAYEGLWGEQNKYVRAAELRGAMKIWKLRSAPTDLWSRIEDFAGATGKRTAFNEEIVLKNGRSIDVSITPMSGGMTVVKFELQVQSRLQIETPARLSNPASP